MDEKTVFELSIQIVTGEGKMAWKGIAENQTEDSRRCNKKGRGGREEERGGGRGGGWRKGAKEGEKCSAIA